MGAAETYDGLRAINPAIKVLLSSGYGADQQTGELLRRGCDGFIQKPFNMQSLSEKIEEILNRA
jgi:two-component system, cell cycle sensor histidine kinase and response regulator CckA